MQYLLKITIKKTPVWRLIAVDGSADLCFVAELIAKSFDYSAGKRCFILNKKDRINAGTSGEPDEPRELNSFDSLGLHSGDFLEYEVNLPEKLEHVIEVMKVEDHLYCLMPSCLVGVGRLPEGELNEKSITSFYDNDESEGLNLKEVTNRLREYGSKRSDVSKSMVKAGAEALKFTMQ